MLLRNDILTFIDLVQTALSCGNDMSMGGLSNLNRPRICDLLSCRRATLHEIACLSIPETARIVRDFIWQYVKSGQLSLAQARLLSVPVCSALEQAELFHLVSNGRVSLERALLLPVWALYRFDLLELWQTHQISEAFILEMAPKVTLECIPRQSGGSRRPPDGLELAYDGTQAHCIAQTSDRGAIPKKKARNLSKAKY